MSNAVDTAVRQELHRAGLHGGGPLARLLTLLRGAEDTHFGLTDAARIAAAGGLPATPLELALQLEALVDHGLLGRVPTTSSELVFDTVPEPHAHLVYEDTAQTLDLHVSAETLLAILRQLLLDRSGSVDILVRVRSDPALAINTLKNGTLENSAC